MKKTVEPSNGACTADCTNCRFCWWKIIAISFAAACVLKIGGPGAIELIAKLVK
jgi:hypothetical protein